VGSSRECPHALRSFFWKKVNTKPKGIQERNVWNSDPHKARKPRRAKKKKIVSNIFLSGGAGDHVPKEAFS